MPGKDPFNSSLDGLIQGANQVDNLSRTESIHQKLRLLAALAVHVIHGVRPIIRISHAPVDPIQILNIIEPLREGGNAVSIGKHKIKPGLSDCLDRLYGVNQGLLAFIVAFNLDLVRVQLKEHRRP